ncbi:MAG: hypothetical protein IIZ61_04140 [Lachnospiraceae bacterium]|nr:hypothetical protein [Lachnospiraceae bacterium]
MFEKVMKFIGKLFLVLLLLFIASIIIYFTNADMKLSAQMAKILEPWYDKMERDRRM